MDISTPILVASILAALSTLGLLYHWGVIDKKTLLGIATTVASIGSLIGLLRQKRGNQQNIDPREEPSNEYEPEDVKHPEDIEQEASDEIDDMGPEDIHDTADNAGDVI